MTRRSSLAATLLLALTGLLLLPGTASAATVNDVVRSLRSDPVYVDPAATIDIDEGRVRDAIRSSGRRVYVAVLPQAAADGSGGPAALCTSIGRGLGDNGATVFSLTGQSLSDGDLIGQSGGASGLAPGQAQQLANDALTGDATDTLVAAVEAVADSAGTAGSGSGSSSGSGSGSDSGGGGGGGTVLGLLALLGLGGGGYLYSRSRKRRTAAAAAAAGSRADVESLYNRLGADVSNLSPGDDAVARQALADASERYTATGALMAKATTPGEWDAARRTVVEGLTAARLVRTRLGLDPGPEVPPPPGQGPQLQAAQRVQVEGQEYEGSPTYAPGRQHYFGGGYLGGQMVPGGWYGVPFWETMLLTSALSGGFGGFGGYGGGGFERGYEEGVEDARDAGGGGGGGWGDWGGGGGFSGGDWGGGGGFSGGDWGGGGGGGGDGGGSW